MYGVSSSALVNAERATVWSFVSRPQNLERFLLHVQDLDTLRELAHHTIQPTSPSIWGQTQLERSDCEYRLSWSSQGGLVQHSGQLELEPRGSDTELKLSLEYKPQNRNAERILARLLADPQALLDQDLERLCEVLETRPHLAGLA